MVKFDHFNLAVTDMEKALEFYGELGLVPVREITPPDGSFRMVHLSDGVLPVTLELKWDPARSAYDHGDNAYHIAFNAGPEEFKRLYELHSKRGIITRDMTANGGGYFVTDPDGNSVEFMPAK